MAALRELVVGGRALPCRITMGAMLRFKRETGRDLQAIEPDDVVSMLRFLFCCVKSACSADGVAFDLEFEAFADLVEPDDFAGFFAEMEGEPQKKTKATEAKKKA